jgi:PPP family 3-phenylpropionic acid transporter
MLVAALILSSHALHDGFAMIRWRAAGIAPGVTGLLWAESVAAEVVVFFAIGRPLLDRLGTGGAAMLAAAAGLVRWTVSAETAALPALALIQPLHGLTFALLHLACMRRLAETVPPGLSATALTLYGTVAIGAASVLLTLASGALYGAIGPQGFWVMAALCAAALPASRRL